MESKPPGASHRLRVWLRSLITLTSNDPNTSYPLPFNDSYIYQRLYKSDNLKMGGRLDFASLQNKVATAFLNGPPQVIVSEVPKEGNATGRTTPSSDLKARMASYDRML